MRCEVRTQWRSQSEGPEEPTWDPSHSLVSDSDSQRGAMAGIFSIDFGGKDRGGEDGTLSKGVACVGK